jgi:hypothetical protein
MSIYNTVVEWFKELWYDLGFPQKEKKMPVSPASVSTGMPNTTATFYGAKKPAKKKKSVKKLKAK